MSINDGYAGQWDSDPKHSVAGSGNFKNAWPLKSKRRPTTYTLSRDAAGYHWLCNECGWLGHTLEYQRPDHDCLEKESA